MALAEIYAPFRHLPLLRLLTPTPSPPTSTDTSRRRVKAIVALRLLEVVRDQDIPGEILEDEDPTVTMPRKLGLSGVVDRQIRTYRSDVRRGARLTDGEITDLFRLVIRRPDSEEIFLRVGHMLAGREGRGGWTRLAPRRVALAVARGRVRRRLRKLFGRRIGGFVRGRFAVEGRSLLFIEADPGGDACAFVSGLCQAILERTTGQPARVTHTLCQSRGDALCRWEGFIEDRPSRSEDGDGQESDASRGR
jgi:hypothetical protein